VTEVKYVEITDLNDVGQRADNFLRRTLKGVPRQYIYRILRKGEVRINGGRVKASYRLKLNDRVRIPPVRVAEQVPVQFSPKMQDVLNASILFEDGRFIVLNKPAGIAVHGGSGLRAGVVEVMREITGNPRLELIHRLDRDTSGCLALAKTRQVLQEAQSYFRQRQVKKIYEAMVHGYWPVKQQTIQLRLRRYETASGERRVRVDSQGQQARTDVAVLQRAGRLATRLQLSLHTGRTHQIRVHLSSSGHAIIGDDKYQARPTQQDNESSLTLKSERLCLHARKLEIPMTSGLLKVSSPPDQAWAGIWGGLKQAAKD